MMDSLDDVPEYIEDDVRKRIAANSQEATLIVDESKEEVLLAYTGFTDALKREYQNACRDRGEESIKVYHLQKDLRRIKLVRFESSKGMNEEKIWIEDA